MIYEFSLFYSCICWVFPLVLDANPRTWRVGRGDSGSRGAGWAQEHVAERLSVTLRDSLSSVSTSSSGLAHPNLLFSTSSLHDSISHPLPSNPNSLKKRTGYSLNPSPVFALAPGPFPRLSRRPQLQPPSFLLPHWALTLKFPCD